MHKIMVQKRILSWKENDVPGIFSFLYGYEENQYVLKYYLISVLLLIISYKTHTVSNTPLDLLGDTSPNVTDTMVPIYYITVDYRV